MRSHHRTLLLPILLGSTLVSPIPARALATDAHRCSPLAAEAALQITIDPLDTLLVGRVVFITFPDSRTGLLPSYAGQLPSELAHYLATQSRGRWRTDIRFVRRTDAPDSAWRAPRPAAEYAGLTGRRYWEANREVLAAIAAEQPGIWDGVDQVWVLHDQCTFPCSDNRTRDTCEDTCPFGGIATLGATELEVPGLRGGGTTQRRYSRANETRDHAIQSSFAVHEFGHRILRAPHAPGSDEGGADWVNFGRYDVLRSGVNGAPSREEGLLPYSPLHLARWGWLPRRVIDRDAIGVPLSDVMGPRGELIEVRTRSAQQSFALALHAGSTPYDERYGGTGLLVWHVLRDASGIDRRWDLESAAGRLSNGQPDPVGGRDALESDPLALGSEADFFQPGRAMVLGPESNPSSRLHELDDFKSPETALSGVAIENLRASATPGDLLVDIWVTPAQLVISPAGGARVPQGEPLVVEWQPRASARVAEVSLELSLDDGASWRVIAPSLPNTGEWSGLADGASERARVRVSSRDSSGYVGSRVSDTFAIEGAPLPPATALSFAPPAPNPSGGPTRLRFTLPSASHVRIIVLDLGGRLVRVLADGERPAGDAEVVWDGLDHSGRLVRPGLYVAILESDRSQLRRRLIRIDAGR